MGIKIILRFVRHVGQIVNNVRIILIYVQFAMMGSMLIQRVNVVKCRTVKIVQCNRHNVNYAMPASKII